MSRRTMAACGILCAIAAAVDCAHGADLSDTDRALLESVRIARAGVMGLVTSGRIVATVSHWQESPKRKGAFTEPSHRLEAVFGEPGSMTREYRSDGGDEEPLRVVLWKDQKKFQYNSPAAKGPSSLHIETGPFPAMFRPSLELWTYREIVECPSGVAESDFWSYVLERCPSVRVEKEGTIVRLTLEDPMEDFPETIFTGRVVEFDMDKSGMMVHWTRRMVEKRNGVEWDVHEERRITWNTQDGIPVPVTRLVEAWCDLDGKPAFRQKNEVHFTSMSFEEVDPEELTVRAMGVRMGTPVVDTIARIQYKYGAQGQFGDTIDDLAPLAEHGAASVTDYRASADEVRSTVDNATSAPRTDQLSDEVGTSGPAPTRAPRIIIILSLVAAALIGAVAVSWAFMSRRKRKDRE